MQIYEWRRNLINSEMPSRAKLAGLILSMFYSEKNPTHPTNTLLLKMTSFSLNTLIGALRELENGGFIEKQKKRLKGNRFTNNFYVFKTIEGSNIEGSKFDGSIKFEGSKSEHKLAKKREKEKDIYKYISKKKKRECHFEDSEFCGEVIPDVFAKYAFDVGYCEEAASDEYLTFKNYWLGKAGSNSIKRDWYATWQNWVRRTKTEKGDINEKFRGSYKTAKQSTGSGEVVNRSGSGTGESTNRKATYLDKLKVAVSRGEENASVEKGQG